MSPDLSSREQLQQFLLSQYNDLYAYLRLRMPQRDAEILIEDIFEAFVLDKKRGQTPPRLQLYTLAHEHMVRYWKQRTEDSHPYGTQQDDIALIGPLQHSTMEQLLVLDEKLARLGVAEREVLELEYKHHFTLEEIAQIIGKSSGDVRVMHLRALRELR